jgi:predicted TIM-barrel fold metal-dependent hydrolase
MASSFTNSHSHIFTANCAPDFFLKTAIHSTWAAELVDRLVKRNGTRWVFGNVLKLMAFFSPHKRDVIRRYLEFVEIGTSASQTDIFAQLNQSYAAFQGHKIIVLTQVLDYLDLANTSSTHMHIRAQVEEVRGIKRNALYGQNIYPFLGLDSRQTGLDLLKDWVQFYIQPDQGFYGIKLYPAAGFFPFDERLEPIWAWAEANNIPVMTHSTRSGSFYLGTFESLINSGVLQTSQLDPVKDKAIITRVAAVIADTSIHKKNVTWCNIFGYPDNYAVVLRKHPKLKICLAHLGGSTEVNRQGSNAKSPFPAYMSENWYEMIIGLMQNNENVYSDISYTLSDTNAVKKIAATFTPTGVSDVAGNPLLNKLLYGTDFYLTQQEQFGDESDLQHSFLTGFSAAQIQALAFDNPAKYLRSTIWPNP